MILATTLSQSTGRYDFPLRLPIPVPLKYPTWVWFLGGGVAGTRKTPSFEGVFVISKSDAEGQSRTDTGSPLPVFEYDALCINQFHHETYSLIGYLVVLAGMACQIKGVGQPNQTYGQLPQCTGDRMIRVCSSTLLKARNN